MSKMFDPSAYNDNDRDTDLQPGEYICMIVDDSETGHVNRQQGRSADYLTFTYKILDPPQHRGLRIWDNQSLSDQSLFMLAKLYKALEPDENARVPFDIDNDDELHAALFYKPVVVVAGWERRQGYEPRLRPKKFKPVVGELFDQIMELAQTMLNDPEKGSEWGAGPRQVPGNDGGVSFELQGASAPEDDDIPF